MKFIKKLIIIDALQWFRQLDHPKVIMYTNYSDEPKCQYCGNLFHAPHATHGWIKTLEGGHIVCPNDWVITGIKGECYPCKPDIFDATYEPLYKAQQPEGVRIMSSCKTCKYAIPISDIQNNAAFSCRRNAPVTKLIETYDGHWTPA